MAIYIVLALLSCLVKVLSDVGMHFQSTVRGWVTSSSPLGFLSGSKRPLIAVTQIATTRETTHVFPAIQTMTLHPLIPGTDRAATKALSALGDMVNKARIIYGGYINQLVTLKEAIASLTLNFNSEKVLTIDKVKESLRVRYR